MVTTPSTEPSFAEAQVDAVAANTFHALRQLRAVSKFSQPENQARLARFSQLTGVKLWVIYYPYMVLLRILSVPVTTLLNGAF